MWGIAFLPACFTLRTLFVPSTCPEKPRRGPNLQSLILLQVLTLLHPPVHAAPLHVGVGATLGSTAVLPCLRKTSPS
ncbi:hypothetical protein BDZ85DRAFT_268591 [Elsinoe ampelina]|uniref:Secreted protein n=1 Tax=Elsinoe ampelina TaxID=302913 RepID=A0A6A6G1F2_9PEZI|nr:hypothetical protein BDZ85DRAFT_268591 [Elsinoe ampelina]